MTMLIENYNDLMERIDQLLQQRKVITAPPVSSPGAQTDKGTTPSTGPPPSPVADSVCTNTYDSAFTLMRGAEYTQAVTTFRTYLAGCPNHESVDNAMYWVGFCLYSSDKFSEAITALKELLAAHPDSRNAGRALYHEARCNQELGKKSEAKKLYEKVVKDHAGTLEAKQAADRLKEM
jgi:tol-pal system protein YbgF